MTITGNEENMDEMVKPWNKGAGDLRKVWKIIKEDIRSGEIQRRNRQYNGRKKKDKNNDPLKHYTLMIEHHKPH